MHIVYEDPYIVIIDKPAGLLSVETSPRVNSARKELNQYFLHTHQRCTAHLVHRLDRETSGLMLYAKTRRVQQILEYNWKNLVYDRRYVAVVSGRMRSEVCPDGIVRSYLRQTASYRVEQSVSQACPNGKLAITHFRILQRGKRNTLIEAKLETGRKHQIRVHLASLGHPVLGDRKYGTPSTYDSLFLHAYRLYLTHPITDRPLQFDTPIPQEFLDAL